MEDKMWQLELIPSEGSLHMEFDKGRACGISSIKNGVQGHLCNFIGNWRNRGPIDYT